MVITDSSPFLARGIRTGLSGQHLRIVKQGKSLVLIHPNPDNPRGRTLNGLLYQGRKIRGDEQFSKVLPNGDIFRTGDENSTLVTLTYSLIPCLLIPQLVFAGVEIPLKEGVLQTAAMFFPMRWAMAALGSSFGLHSDKLGGRTHKVLKRRRICAGA